MNTLFEQRDSVDSSYGDLVISGGAPSFGVLGLCQFAIWQEKPRIIPSMFSSVMLHIAVTVFLLNVPVTLFFSRVFFDDDQLQYQAPPKVYEVQALNLKVTFPVLDPDGPGGKPGIGDNIPRPPARGTTKQDPHIKMVSNFPKPDNTRQTIIQPEFSPELKIPVHVELPNVILGSSGRSALPRLGPQPLARPVIEVKADTTRRSRQVEVAELALTTPPIANPMPALPVRSASIPSLGLQDTVGRSSKGAPASGAGVPGDNGRQLTVLGVDPGLPSGSLQVPPGQRYGNFSVYMAVEGGGSPGGVEGGTKGGGQGVGGNGGDRSSGVGSGDNGGGGTRPSAGAVPVSVTGEAGAPGGISGLMPADINSFIFAVPRPPSPYRESFVVTAGSGGGGGLHLYGVLKSGKVYTAYLPMPGRNWVLQYCAHEVTSRRGNSRDIHVQLDAPVAPPAAEERFDFRRVNIPSTAKDDLLILRGWIRADGSIDKLEVFQGVNKVTDQIAVATFKKWKFKPARTNGKAVDVEILVGIPTYCPRCK